MKYSGALLPSRGRDYVEYYIEEWQESREHYGAPEFRHGKLGGWKDMVKGRLDRPHPSTDPPPEEF